jgi:hypothetical protein
MVTVPKKFDLWDYRRLRRLGWGARDAFLHAKAEEQFNELAYSGRVRIDILPDEDADPDNILGDAYDPASNQGVQRSTLERQRNAILDAIERDGVWGAVAKYQDINTGAWIFVDSIWGFVGDSFADSGYDTELRTAAVCAFIAQTERNGL